MRDNTGEALLKAWASAKPSTDAASSVLVHELQALYDAYAEPLLRFGVNATADLEFARESVQEVFLRYAELRQAAPTPPTPFLWLLRELRFAIARRGRDRDRRAGGKLSRYLPADPAPSPEAQALLSEARRIVNRLAAPRELECFLLRSEGLSYLEIADVMGISIGTVGATLARAVRKLELAVDLTEVLKR
ncbi:MAG: sigma-70 family RNA polymerase sigma factor [Acidobacteriota bacterium]